jgi:DNA-binding transcriptional LysR family regulator
MPDRHKLRSMDLRHARTFVTVAELGTVSAAAVRLRVAQPALSRQIDAFEHELGLKLFDRAGRRLVLTGIGEQLLRECRDLLNAAEAVSERARLLQTGEVGLLRVAASPQFIEGVLASFLHRYSERYPNVRIVLTEAIGWSDVEGLLERGDVHLGQNLLHALPPNDTRFARDELEPVDLLAVCTRSRKLGKGKAIEIERLAEHPLLLLDGSFIFRRTFDAACRLAGIRPNIMFESRTPHTLLAMAECGHGVAIIPSALRASPDKFCIVRITYRGEPLREPLAVYWQTRRPLPPYGQAFLGMLREYVREVFPVTRPA